MPATLTYPGVYVEEIPSGVRTITGVATSITAFVGYTARGPVNRAVRVLGFGDFERAFGGLHRDSEVAYAIQQFFLNGGADAYVVRVAKDTSVASVKFKHGGGAGDEALLVEAANAGIWGNSVRLDVDYATSNPDSTFNLNITRYELRGGKLVPAESELFRNLSMNSRSSAYAPNVVNPASKLIRLKRLADMSAAGRGFSLSGSLASFPTLTAQDSTISGVLDGADAFTLVLADPPAISAAANKINDLVTALTAAVTAAGLATRLEVARANALGANDAAGNHVKLTSLAVVANPNTADEFSSVQITTAPANDAAAKLKLGLSKGGREKEAASSRRPLPTGAVSADLADLVGANVSGAINVTINDNSTGVPVAILPSTPLAPPLPATAVGPALRDQLQTLIRALPHAAAQNATVQLMGSRLRVLPSATTPNASISLSGAGATAVRLTGGGSFDNVQQYSLGVGATFGAQTGAAPGADGTPPDANAIIGNDAAKTGIYTLRDVDLFNLLSIPRTTQLSDAQAKSVIAAAMALCAERRAFYLVDPDPTKGLTDIADWVSGIDASKNAAVFFPRIQVADPLDDFRLRDMPASGAVAGVFARTDGERGVWKAPAGIDASLRGVQGLSYALTDLENGTLNPHGINCLRSFPVYGRVVWGARTLEGDDARASEWKYVPVRRVALFIEESLFRGTKWVVFEPNDEPLWSQIRLNIGAFMQNLFRQGAFQGKTARDAYFVKCDRETTTQNDINLGIVNIVVGFAPLKPAEFVVIKIQQMAGQIAT
jgi:phage tail sheath protein FI